MDHFTATGQQVKKLLTTVASDGATIQYRARGRDFWVTETNGHEHHCRLGRREADDLEHPWWLAVRAARLA